jgi:competence ComEA-like helix-hairpin-helix protein
MTYEMRAERRAVACCSDFFGLVLCAAQNLPANKKPPVHPVNLNAASSAELLLVPGIGPPTADKILQPRKSYGAYKSVDDLLAIKGIGQERLDKMHRYLTVGKIPPTKAASTKPVSPPKPHPPNDGEGRGRAILPALIARL